eukprot:c36877_g1_i1.p1 GENE.c36877_g1_i1~~c36877_g1_i1.p1  ORF type:complete len:235 (+),score=79.03 c36877_g1_i1:29-733(+)
MLAKKSRTDQEDVGQEEEDATMKALNDIQEEFGALQKSFSKDIFDLQKQHALKKKPLIEKRKECIKNIDGFWATVLQNHQSLTDLCSDEDVFNALRSLEDISITYGDSPKISVTLHFHFKENEYFSDRVLTKTMTMEDDGWKVQGSQINWKAGKDLTAENDGHAGKKRSQPESFSIFSWFGDEEDNEVFELLKDEVIDNAITLYFDDDEQGDEGEEGDEDDDGEEDGDSEEDGE